MKNYIYLDGKKIAISDETAKQISESFKEEELTSFDDCWDKVIKGKESYFLNTSGNIRSARLGCEEEKYYPNLPRKELVRKIQLYIILLTVAEAVNDGWTFDHTSGVTYSYISLSKTNKLHTRSSCNIRSGDILFKDVEAAKKALRICPWLWEEYLSIQ